MEREEIIKEILTVDIDQAELILYTLKENDKNVFDWCIENLKLHFILSNDILVVNKLALIFSTFRLHSTVPIMLSKLFNKKFLKDGGTIIYALEGLKISHFKATLDRLKNQDISYEMNLMLKLHDK